MALPVRSLALGVTGMLLAAALGTTLGAYVLAPPVPDSLAGPEEITSVMVTSRPHADERSVRIRVQLKQPEPVNTPVTGRITALSVASNTTLTSGTKVMEVDGLPVVALQTSTPLYRELVDDASGDDIAALQDELQRLGFDVAVTGRVNWSTRKAAADLLGVDDGQGGVPESIPHTSFLWLPARTVTVNEVKVHLGDTLTEGAQLLTLTGGANTGTVDIPPQALPGDRVLVFQDKEYPIGANGVVEDQELLTKMLSAAQQQNSGGEGQNTGETSLTLSWRLATPIEVQIVPAAALFGVSADHGCVSSEGRPVRVKIIASELGQTFVHTDQRLGEVSLKPEAMSCQ